MRTRVVVNPHSSGNRTGALWPEIETKLRAAIGDIETVMTDGKMVAPRLVSEALDDGVERIISVGGDGTINEVVNGFFRNGDLINDQAVLSFLTSGTGGDFRKTFDIPADIDGQIERLANAQAHSVDIGKLSYTDFSGNEALRYFNNIASFGLSGAADKVVNELTFAKKFGGKFAFQWGVTKAFFKYKNQRVRIRVDDTLDDVFTINTAAACNGRYFGGGMKMAPEAEPDDGLFDIVIIGGLSKLRSLRETKLIYDGAHIGRDNVTSLRGRKLVATPEAGESDVLLDVDGEAPGTLPATFEILPKALRLNI